MTVQKGGVAASAWKDKKVVMIMSSNCQPSAVGEVRRRQLDASRIPVPCPENIISYNNFMGGVDLGDQLRGYYRCWIKSRKFYKYIFYFLFDVAITNSYILHKHQIPCSFKTVKCFRIQLAKELIGDYCSRRRRGRRGTVIHPLPFQHYPIKLLDGASKPKRGRCEHHKAAHNSRVDTTWFCRECSVWLCHNGDPANDCFMLWHKRRHL